MPSIGIVVRFGIASELWSLDVLEREGPCN
jgi:hypothetical protein